MFAELHAMMGERFERENIDAVIYNSEQVFTQQHYPMYQYIDAINNNYYAKPYSSAIATHGYDESGVVGMNPDWTKWSALYDYSNMARKRELWMTETYPAYENWDSAFDLALAMHGALVWGNVSWWTLWNIEGTLLLNNAPTASFYTSKNYFKYIRPGARRVDVVVEDDRILGSAFIHPESKQQTIVLINNSDADISANLLGERHAEYYDVFTTAENMDFEYQGMSGKGGDIILPAKSVTTLVGTITEDVVADIDEEQVPEGYRLDQNFPNPFNPETMIRFQIPELQKVNIDIYNLLGQKVKTLVKQSFAPGYHTIQWNGDNDKGLQVVSGIYIYRLRTKNFMKPHKCILLR